MNKDEQLKAFVDKLNIIPHDQYLDQLTQPYSVLVCSLEEWPAHFTDDLFWYCDNDGCRNHIRFRPYNLIAFKRICIPCTIDYMKKMKGSDDAQMSSM